MRYLLLLTAALCFTGCQSSPLPESAAQSPADLEFTRIADEFLETMVSRTKQIRIGDPLLEDTQMGPLATIGQLMRIENEVAFAQEEGAKILTGGHRPSSPARGWYYEPTIVECHDQKLRIVEAMLFAAAVELFNVLARRNRRKVTR